jgi:hypothetical protein
VPALPPVPNVLKVRIHWSVGSDTAAVNVLHWRYAGTPPSDASCVTIATDVRSAVATTLLGLVTTHSSLTGADVTDLTSDIAGQGAHFQSSGGGGSSSALSPGTCLLQSLKIARRYRGGKPRTYWPLGASGDLGTNLAWAGGFVTSATSQLAAFTAAMNAITVAGCNLTGQVNVSYYEGFTVSAPDPITGRVRNVPTPRTTPLIDPVTSFVVDPHPASQRRRNLQGV